MSFPSPPSELLEAVPFFFPPVLRFAVDQWPLPRRVTLLYSAFSFSMGGLSPGRTLPACRLGFL